MVKSVSVFDGAVDYRALDELYRRHFSEESGAVLPAAFAKVQIRMPRITPAVNPLLLLLEDV